MIITEKTTRQQLLKKATKNKRLLFCKMSVCFKSNFIQCYIDFYTDPECYSSGLIVVCDWGLDYCELTT